jgi:hypothetical protein
MTQANFDLSEESLVRGFERYQELQQSAIREEDIPAANRHFTKMKAHADALARTLAGRAALEGLLASLSPFIRLRAAHRVLTWAPEKAIPVLGHLLIDEIEPPLTPQERVELKLSAKETLYGHFGIGDADQNKLIEPLRAYGVDLPYRDYSAWQ